MEKQISLTSSQGVGDSSDFTIEYAAGFDCSQNWTLRQVSIPTVAYNITAANNTIDYNCNGTYGTISIAEGLYGITDFANTVVAALDTSSGAVWSITYSETTMRLTFGCNLPFSLFFKNGAHSGPRNNLWAMLGFNDGAGGPVDTVVGTSAVGAGVVNFVNPLNYNILLYVNDKPIGSIIVNKWSQWVTFQIPNTVNNGSVCVLTCDQLNQSFVCPDTVVSKIRVQLFDDLLSPINMHGVVWSLLIVASP